jgi:uncharacterized membrane protein YdjX (TVP38/TMEM64 family)
MVETISKYASEFLTVIVVFVVAINFVPIAVNATAAVSAYAPLLSTIIVGTVLGAALLLYLLKNAF